MIKKPSVFIGSSSEALRVAERVQQELVSLARPKLWNQGVFGLGWSFLETLVSEIRKHDFAVLVLSPDDRTTSRKKQHYSPRDNVLFELGLFMGHLGRERTFVLYDSAADLKLLSDLTGIANSSYDGSWVKDDVAAAVGAACHSIKEAIRQLGPLPAIQNGHGSTGPSIGAGTGSFWTVGSKIDPWVQSCDRTEEGDYPWLGSSQVLELRRSSLTPSAYYIWRDQPVNAPITISFTATFPRHTMQQPAHPDLRIALFSRSPRETYLSYPHMLLHIPWEGGGTSAAFIGRNPPTIAETQLPGTYNWDEPINYKVSVAADRAAVWMNDVQRIQIPFSAIAPLRINTSVPWFWGFSTVGGWVRITDIAIANR